MTLIYVLVIHIREHTSDKLTLIFPVAFIGISAC
jgi:hypothetical protein